MSGTHTPGPWGYSDGNLVRVTARRSDGYHAVVAGVHRIGKHTGVAQGDVIANARLISAAPALLEALTSLVALVRGECPSLLNEDSGGDAALSIRIDEVLALATPSQKEPAA